MYTVFLMFGTLIMCTMLTAQLSHAMLVKMTEYDEMCKMLQVGENCELLIGYMAVYRIALAMVVFFLLFSLLTVNVTTSRSCRAGLHNGFWLIKFILLCALFAAAFAIPTSHLDRFTHVWMYIALIGALLFIVIQMLMLVDFTQAWTDKWRSKAEDTNSQSWYIAMVMCAMVFYALFATGVILLYVSFTRSAGCNTNKFFIGINVALCLISALVSVLPCVEKSTGDARAGLFHSAVISLFILYLTWSALASEPQAEDYLQNVQEDKLINVNDKDDSCGPEPESKLKGSEPVIPYIGAVILFLSVTYSSISTSQQVFNLGISIPTLKSNPCEFCCPVAPNLRRVEDDGGQVVIRNEAEGVVYSYAFYHIIYSLAAMYLMMTLTNWLRPELADLASFDKNWVAVWVKMSSSWLCIAIYLWRLLAPQWWFGGNSPASPKPYEPEAIEMESPA